MPSVAASLETGLKSVLLATDFSKASSKPLRRALAIARHYNAKFYLTHIVSSLGYTLAGPPALELACEAAERDVQHLEKTLLQDGSLAQLEHEFIVRRGVVWEQLQNVIAEKQVDLVVLGTHARRTLGKLILGSVAEQIFRRAECLVLTVGPGSSQDSPLDNAHPLRPILFATDFGGASLRALPYAISFANHFHAKLVLLHVAPIAPIPEGFHWSSTTTDIRQLRDNARYAALSHLQDLVSRSTPLHAAPEFVIKFGSPPKVIQHVAADFEADLIIMGLNHTRHFDTAAHTPWHTAYEVVCTARCPVLTVRS